ncbi:MAG TPA: PAS domain S-box protein, partial [Flavobacterium sp.]|nr:PAS domain S-box protein [Flavobacterium sp.]
MPILIALLFIFTYQFLKIQFAYKNKAVNDFNKIDSIDKEYQLYLLFLGIMIPIFEIIFEIFKVRPKSMFAVNCTVGAFFIVLYFISKKSDRVLKNIQPFFVIIYFGYFSFIARNMVFRDDIIPMIGFVLSFFFAYNVIKPMKLYWSFVVYSFAILLATAIFELMPLRTIIILTNYCCLIAFINYIRHVSRIIAKDKFRFTNEIVHKGNTLTIAANKKGELSFCSESITEILGYSPEEVMGLQFWALTEDPEFVGKEYHADYIDNRLYIRKLKCKNGEYKYIQWKDKKFTEDMIIGIGQDITDQVHFQSQYRNLVETATDLIYEVNAAGGITYVNPFAIKTLGYTKEEILSMNYQDFLPKDHLEAVTEFYTNLPEGSDYTDFVFPIRKKNNEVVWVSQKVTVKKGESNDVVGYSAFARDITLIKNLETEHYERARKVRTHN